MLYTWIRIQTNFNMIIILYLLEISFKRNKWSNFFFKDRVKYMHASFCGIEGVYNKKDVPLNHKSITNNEDDTSECDVSPLNLLGHSKWGFHSH